MVGGYGGLILILSDTLCITLIYIAINFHQDISYCYLVMACTRRTLEIYRRDVTLNNKGKQSFLCAIT